MQHEEDRASSLIHVVEYRSPHMDEAAFEGVLSGLEAEALLRVVACRGCHGSALEDAVDQFHHGLVPGSQGSLTFLPKDPEA